MINSFNRLALALTATLAIAAPAFASAKEASSFERNGTSYTYTAVDVDGSTVIKGTANGRPFRLTVKDDMVKGTFNGSPVRFSLDEVKGGAAGLAMR